MTRLEEMRDELIRMSQDEAMRLWRMARRAEKHGASKELVHDIREEANIMYTTMVVYPERLLEWKFKYTYKYAFK